MLKWTSPFPTRETRGLHVKTNSLCVLLWRKKGRAIPSEAEVERDFEMKPDCCQGIALTFLFTCHGLDDIDREKYVGIMKLNI